jgi:hypothetical protein
MKGTKMESIMAFFSKTTAKIVTIGGIILMFALAVLKFKKDTEDNIKKEYTQELRIKDYETKIKSMEVKDSIDIIKQKEDENVAIIKEEEIKKHKENVQVLEDTIRTMKTNEEKDIVL